MRPILVPIEPLTSILATSAFRMCLKPKPFMSIDYVFHSLQVVFFVFNWNVHNGLFSLVFRHIFLGPQFPLTSGNIHNFEILCMHFGRLKNFFVYVKIYWIYLRLDSRFKRFIKKNILLYRFRCFNYYFKFYFVIVLIKY